MIFRVRIGEKSVNFLIDIHAACVTIDEDENKDSTCHGMSLHQSGALNYAPTILNSFVGA